jgi:large subunit ribosomal protein L7/L12
MNELINKIADHYDFDEGMLSPDDDGSGGGGGGDDDDDAPEAAAAVEKTIFDIKLVAFDPTSKIKVIKEVRAIAGLGLKEAKEMVEGAPKTILKDIKKEQAEEIKAKLEELGATVEIV